MIGNCKNILWGGIVFFLIYPLSCCQKTHSTSETPETYSPQSVGEQPTEYLVLRFHFVHDSVAVKQVRKYFGKLPGKSQKIEGEDFQLVLLDSLNQKLFTRYFPTPGNTYYDQIDSSGTNLSGGQITFPESILELKVPYFTHLRTLKMISPQQKIIWQAELKNILKTFTK